MLAENPLYSYESSDWNSIIILFAVLDMIFLFQLLRVDSDLGPKSGPVKYASKARLPAESISFIDM